MDEATIEKITVAIRTVASLTATLNRAGKESDAREVFECGAKLVAIKSRLLAERHAGAA